VSDKIARVVFPEPILVAESETFVVSIRRRTGRESALIYETAMTVQACKIGEVLLEGRYLNPDERRSLSPAGGTSQRGG
jgi:hypothetical protein